MGLWMKKIQVLVVGNGMVCHRFCERLIEYDAYHKYAVTVLGDEPISAYDRIALSTCFDGRPADELMLANRSWYRRSKITLKTQTRVTSINRTEKYVETNDGETIAYDRLVLATGARPHLPPIPGVELPHVFVYRTLADLEAIRSAAGGAKQAVVIGGGLLGLEAAQACHSLGLKTTVLERESHLMALQLDETGGGMLRREVESIGLHIRTNEKVAAIETASVLLEPGEDLPADLVIVATGIRPNDELAIEADLKIGLNGGIAVDEKMQTSDASIYAIGECASFEGTTFGLVAPGYAMAEAAAAHLGNINKTFTMTGAASQLKLLDLQVASLGNSATMEPGMSCTIMKDETKGVYKKLIIDTEKKRLVGAILMGETSEFDQLRKYIDTDLALPEISTLLVPIGTSFIAESEMEEDDLVCFCNYVTKRDICRAIDRENLSTAGEVMGVTYAAGLCGSCVNQVIDVTKQHVDKRAAEMTF